MLLKVAIKCNCVKSKDFEKYDLNMVNVFATWCTACVKEIPDLVEFQNEMKNKGVNIVGVYQMWTM